MINRSILICVSTILLVVFFSNCKKPNNNPCNCDCINSQFKKELDIKIRPTYIAEDNKGFIILAGNWDNVVQVVKLDGDGNLRWHKSYPGLTGKEHGLTYIDENAFFISTSTDQYEYIQKDTLYKNVWIKIGLQLDSTNNYVDAFEFEENVMPMLQLPNTNNTYLTKFDAEGDIIWSKEFEGDYCDGNSFYRIDHNNFLFLTSSFFGPYYELIEHNGSVDTIDAPNDKNKRTLFKIDAEGNVIWTTVIDNVFEMAKAGEDFYFTIQQSLTVNKDRIIVNTLNNTFELTHDGTLTKSFQPAYNYQGNNTYYMIRASDDENYFFSQVHNYYDPNPHFNSLYKYNLTTNQTVWENDKTYFPMHIKSNENGELFAMSDQGIFVIEKYNNIGQVLWRKEFERNMGERTALTSSCNGGVIMAKYEFDKEKLVVFKTNAMGDYE